jgi:outer membrane protein assembly factor BamE (lipoprotein component of BamABCDE complex)
MSSGGPQRAGILRAAGGGLLFLIGGFMKNSQIWVVLCALLLGGCAVGGNQAKLNETETTVGTVQKEIRVGMSGADVAAALGSPNVVTTDELRREVWIYDKISTETAYSKTEAGVFLLVLGGSSESGKRSTTQKTLTVIVKFDEKHLVRDFAYHASKF